MRPPEFITFTGADDETSIEGMRELARRYPIEWGVLLCADLQGNGGRYPGSDALVRLVYWSGTRLAAHLCGDHSRRIMAGGSLAEHIPVDLGICRRIQVNHETPGPARLVAFRKRWGAERCVAQTLGAALYVRRSEVKLRGRLQNVTRRPP
jgi:hypothetical protein